MKYTIRKVVSSDIDGLKKVLDSSQLFPSELLDELISEYLTDPESETLWFTCQVDNGLTALAYCVPEKLTDGTYNLLAIAVDAAVQGKGIGSDMMRHVEQELKRLHKRLLIVDTSSNEEYASARKFYIKAGYTLVATIKDFWKDGEDKITFCKRLV